MAGDKGNNKYFYGGIGMRNIQNYVEEMFKSVPDSEQKENIINDIKQNLEEKVWDLMEQGKSEEDAINKAIVEFGDIEDIKKELKVNQPEKRDKARIHLGFSIWGSLLIIALSMFVNFYYTPHAIWFVYPTFAVSWWPLAMFYKWLSLK
jgi:hypothetical protein